MYWSHIKRDLNPQYAFPRYRLDDRFLQRIAPNSQESAEIPRNKDNRARIPLISGSVDRRRGFAENGAPSRLSRDLVSLFRVTEDRRLAKIRHGFVRLRDNVPSAIKPPSPAGIDRPRAQHFHREGEDDGSRKSCGGTTRKREKEREKGWWRKGVKE